jgi:undecaprenyl-phosphate 4-deoxy-4-formamido-L-arabinose transferase
MLLSFTIPCYRSENTIKAVVNEIILNVQKMDSCDYEIIAVNDASPDGTWEILKELSDCNPRIKAIDLAGNVGKHAALMAAFSMVEGEIVIGVDDDGQCPINELPKLLAPLNDGYDMSMAHYPKKKQSVFKNFGSLVNDFMVRFLIGKPKGMTFSNYIARKRFVCEEIIKYKNPYPYLEGLTLRTTQKIAMVPMEERERQSGKSGYTFKKSIALWVNGCTAFSVKPLRLSTVLGLVFSMIGFGTGIFMIVRKLISPDIQAGYTSIVALMLLIGGVIMMLLGIIGEYLGRIYICINNSPQYVIRERRNVERNDIE